MTTNLITKQNAIYTTFEYASSTNTITGKWDIMRVPTRHSHLPELGAAPEWLLPRAFLASGNCSGEWEFPPPICCCYCCPKGRATDAATVAGNTNGGGGHTNSNDTQIVPCAPVTFPKSSQIVVPRSLQDFPPSQSGYATNTLFARSARRKYEFGRPHLKSLLQQDPESPLL
jgi:hypothetical protein